MTTIVLAAVAVSALSGCPAGRTAVPGQSPESEVTMAGGRQLVALIRYEGGLVAAGWSVIQPPKVAVYSDGLAVADASRALTVSRDELTSLVAGLRHDLSGFGPIVDIGAPGPEVDASTTILQVLTSAGSLQTVRADSLGYYEGYPDQLKLAERTLSDLAKRVTRDGRAYQNPERRIRLVTIARNDTGQPVPNWPAAVPIPPPVANYPAARLADLSGDVALALQQAVPNSISMNKPWPLLRTPAGDVLSVAWRYLLPHE